MKQKTILLLLAICVILSVQAQTGSFDKVNVKSALKLNNKTITDISTDVRLSSVSDAKLPTERAVKSYIDNLPAIRNVGTGIVQTGDTIYFGGESYDGCSYRIKYIDPDYGNDVYGAALNMSATDFTIRYKNKYAKFTDDGIYMDGGSSQQTITAGILSLSTDGVGLGHSDGYYNSGIDLQVATDGSISFNNSAVKNGDAANTFLTTDINGKLILKSTVPPVQPVQNLTVFTTSANWDLSGGNGRANLTLTANATLVMINPTAGQEGYLLVTVSTPGATIIFPPNSYQLKADGFDTVALNSISDRTKVGVSNGANATGKWLCKFLYDGTNFYWQIHKADTMN